MKLEPLNQWICDRCYQVIKSSEEGLVEWLMEKDEGTGIPLVAFGFRITHHAMSSPSAPHGNCRLYRDRGCDAHLREFVGSEGLAMLTHFLDPGPGERDYKGPEVRSVREWLELFRRIQLPGYEEARQYWGDAKADGFFEDEQWGWYSSEMLQSVIKKYGKRSP